MDLVVLVKYVADVDHIPPDAWDTTRGTLKRNLLRMVPNPLDDRALAMALDLQRRSGGTLWVLSMGPPQAEEICRRAVAHGAHGAVLLSDPAFSGADTIATAHVLAAAVRELIIRGAVRDPLVFAGMQSPDGDTAQVPVQVAALLDYPLIPYVTQVQIRHRGSNVTAEFETLQPRGRGALHLSPPPALATVTSLAPPLSEFLSLERLASAADAQIPCWDAATLGLAAGTIGLAGSRTRVVRIFAPERRQKQGYRLDFGGERDPLEELPAVMRSLREYLHSGGAAKMDTATSSTTDNGTPPYYRGDCMVLCERVDGEISSGSRELLGVAFSLAQTLGVAVCALVPGAPSPGEVKALSQAGAHRVTVLPAHRSEVFVAEEHAAAVIVAAQQQRPQILLVPASLTGRVVAPLVAARLGAGLTADCTGLHIADYQGTAGGQPVQYGKVLFQTRPALGGNVMATIVALRGAETGAPQMASARPGVFPEIHLAGGGIPIDAIDVQDNSAVLHNSKGIRPGGLAFLPQTIGGEEDVDLDTCDVIVAVGLGIGSRENVNRLARPLVRAIEQGWGVTAGLGCSRAAMEAGFLPHALQVGQTGRTVRPRLYIALGISGAVQHRVGMENAGRILSINSDSDAPITAGSDYVIRARCEEAVPILIEACMSGSIPEKLPSEEK